MADSKTPGSATYAVSRSRGKQPGESLYLTKLREKKKEKGMATSSDESEPEDEIEPGAKILHQLFRRKVVLHSDNTVVKSGTRIAKGEAEALKVAALAGISAPRLLESNVTPDSCSFRMSYIPGESLDKLWPSMTVDEKKDIARQLRIMVEQMRSVAPPANLIGACDGTEIRDTRSWFSYHSPPCEDEKAFNDHLLAALYKGTPPLVQEALARQLRTDHRIVLSHCDLAPRNILVQDGKIQGLVDWEDSGWYPEYWEYVKFFQCSAEGDWKHYAQEVFPKIYHEELATHVAISVYQAR